MDRMAYDPRVLTVIARETTIAPEPKGGGGEGEGRGGTCL